VINPTTVEGAKAPGFFCEVCMCLLKDSASYLDHINGKKRRFLFFCILFRIICCDILVYFYCAA
jgi:hypothetical protein